MRLFICGLFILFYGIVHVKAFNVISTINPLDGVEEGGEVILSCKSTSQYVLYEIKIESQQRT